MTCDRRPKPPDAGINHPMTIHLIRSGDIDLHTHDRGAGFPILLLHGMWCDHHVYDDVVDGLADAYRIICPDLRGHGRSGAPAQSWNVRDLARDLFIVLDALAIRAAVVVGHSLGGMAALHMALDDPARLRGLVLLSTSAEAEKPERRSQLSLMAMTLNMWGMNRWMTTRAAKAFFSPAFVRRSPGKVKAWREHLQSMDKRALLQALAAVRDRPSVLAQLDTLEMPALVMGTREDPIADPAHAAIMARRLRNAQRLMLPGGGHALPVEHPQALIQALRQFVEVRIP